MIMSEKETVLLKINIAADTLADIAQELKQAGELAPYFTDELAYGLTMSIGEIEVVLAELKSASVGI